MVGYDRSGEDHGKPRTGRMVYQLIQSPEIGGPAPSCGLCSGLEQENDGQLFQSLEIDGLAPSCGLCSCLEQENDCQLFQSPEICGLAPSCGLCFGLQHDNAFQLFLVQKIGPGFFIWFSVQPDE